MDMMTSLKNFKKDFIHSLVGIHWRHWSAIGVASHVKPEDKWVIDPEALFISTVAIGLNDERLFTACLEWSIKNEEWVSTSRLRRLMTSFVGTLPNNKTPVLNPAISIKLSRKYHIYENAFKKYHTFSPTEDLLLQQYDNVLSSFKVRDVLQEISVLKPIPLLLINLRNFFGMDSRADVALYLLFSRPSSSLAISKEVYQAQPTVYHILEKWTKIGFVEKVDGKYSLNRDHEWKRLWKISDEGRYANWGKVFLVTDSIAKALSTKPWEDDKYLLSSLFRGIYPKAQQVADIVNISLPEPDRYIGQAYFDPFADKMIKVLKCFGG
jgi:hypothetical protein